MKKKTGGDLRLDIVVIKLNLLYILGLTIGFENNISSNDETKEQEQAGLIEGLNRSC